MSGSISVELVDHMGDDASVVNAARVSFDSAKPSTVPLTDRDARLIRYLAAHQHWTPFAHTCVSLRVTAPIVVRTQCFKHKVGLVENEVSRRYVSTMPDVFIPAVWRGRPDGGIKQGSAGEIAAQQSAGSVYADAVDRAMDAYARLLELGVAPEQARLVLPQGVMTSWVWTGSLPAFARFCQQRLASDAQAETREVARRVHSICLGLFPYSWMALNKE